MDVKKHGLKSATVISQPSFYKPLKDVACFEGTPVILECYVRGYPLPEVRWEKAGRLIGNSRNIRIEREGGRCRLHVKVCTQKESGKYTCLAQNKEGLVQTSAVINVYPSSASLKPAQNGQILEVGVLTRSRSARGERLDSPSSSLVHRQTVRCSSTSPNRRGFSKGNFTSKHIETEVRKGLSNGIVKLNGRIELKPNKSNVTQIHPPHFAPTQDRDKVACVGECVRLSCSVTGSPRPFVRWKKTGIVDSYITLSADDIQSDPQARITCFKKGSSHFLEIKTAAKDDSGTYVAVAENCAGKTELPMRLDVRGRRNGGNNLKLENKTVHHLKLSSTKQSSVTTAQQGNKSDGSNSTNGGGVASNRMSKRAGGEKQWCQDLKASSAVALHRKVDGRTRVTKLDKQQKVECKLDGNVKEQDAVITGSSKADGDLRLIQSIEGAEEENQAKDCHGVVSSADEPEDSLQGLKKGSRAGAELLHDDKDGPKASLVSRRLQQSPVFSFDQKLKDLEVSDGESVTLTVGIQEAGIELVQNIVWYRNDQEIVDCPNFQYVTSEKGNRRYSLVIADVFPEDGGDYACVVTASDGRVIRTHCRLTVKAKLQGTFTDTESSDISLLPSLVESSSGVIQTKANSLEPKQTNSSQILLVEVDDEKSVHLKGQETLHLTNHTENDWLESGCVAAPSELANGDCNPPQNDSQDEYHRPRDSKVFPARGSVPHRYTPAQILKGPQSLAVLRGENVTLRTHFIGTAPVKVTWLKGGKIIDTSGTERINISVEEGMSVLAIHDVMADDSGKYVVSVENEGGSDCHFASVAVEGPPYPPSGQPTISDVTTHSLVVSWYGSAYDGGSVITGYIVEMCVLPDTRWTRISASCHSTSYHVRDLLPNRQYVFRVRAENVHGVSDPGAESEPILLSDDAEEEKELEDFAPFEHRVVEIDDETNFEDHYELNQEVGKGRFGVVYKCIELNTGEERAAKVIRCVKSRDKQKVKDEVAIMNRLRHPKLLQLAAAFEKPREIILVTEFISGGELFERVIADDFVLTERDCILFMRQICEGVRYMHANYVIHLDLKPENILCKTQTSHQIKIIDFGLARIYNPAEKLHVLFGTPEFVAPEVISYEPVSLASDMWSLGVICYVLLSGLSPFMGDTDTETFSNITRAEFDFDDEAFDTISDDAKEFISLLLLKVPEKRMTAEDCLRHHWLTQERHKMKGVQLSTDKLKKFIIRRKWQKTGNAIRALGRIQSLSGYSSGRSSVGSFSSYSSVTGSDSSDASVPNNSSSLPGSKCTREVIKEHEEDAYFSGESSHGDAEESISLNFGVKSRKTRKSQSDSDYSSVEAPSFLKLLGGKTMRVVSGQNLKLEVQVDGGPEPEVVWLKSDVVLEDKNDKYRISRSQDGVCSLEIVDCQEEDEDEYTCVAFNRAGHISTSVVLHVDPPEADDG